MAMGSPSFTLYAFGSNFVSGSQIEWNGTALVTTYVTAGQLSAQVPASDLTIVANVQITVFSPGASGGTSNALIFEIENPQPQLSSISPSSATPGNGALTLTASGSNFISGAQVEWNGVALPTTYVSASQLTAQVPAANLASAGSAQVTVVNPAPVAGPSFGFTFSIAGSITNVYTAPVVAHNIVWDAVHSLIYATVPSTNSVAAINPVSASTVNTRAAGSNPNQVAISSDGSYLWVGEDGSAAVQRFALPNLSPDINIPLPPSTAVGYSGPVIALNLQAAPGEPHSVAVLMGSCCTSPRDVGGTAIYDDTTERAGVAGGWKDINASNMTSLQWGANDSTLYGTDDGDSGFDFYTMKVNATGAAIQSTYGLFLSYLAGTMHFDSSTGYLYGDNGMVADPVAGEIVGTFDTGPLRAGVNNTQCVVDSSQGIVFFLGYTANLTSGGGITLQAFSQKTYQLLRTMVLPNVVGTPVSLIRWGNAGLAFNTTSPSSSSVGNIYLVDGDFVNSAVTADSYTGTLLMPSPALTSISPQSAIAGTGQTTLTVSGANFQRGATVNWNGTALTTVASGSQLQATIPASDLATAGSGAITVSNGGLASVNALAFTVLPQGSGITAINLGSAGVAWDPHSALLYAVGWSNDAQYPNSVVAIDPTTGLVARSQFVGTDPYLVRATADGAYLYLGYLTNDLITQLQLPGLNSPLNWGVGSNSTFSNFPSPQSVVDLQPAPAASQTIAVIPGNSFIVPRSSGSITIFDNNVPRPTTPTKGDHYYGELAWGADDTHLYATDTMEPSNFFTLGVVASGVSQLNTYSNILPESGHYMHFDAGTGYLYDDSGYVINPATGAMVGSYGGSGMVAPDSSLNRVFIVGQTSAQSGSGNYTIESFNQTTFASVSSITLTGVVGVPTALVRWGATGLALTTTGGAYTVPNDASTPFTPEGMLYIITSASFVSAHERNTEPVSDSVNRTWSSAFPHISAASVGGRRGSKLSQTNSPASQ